PHPKRKRFLSFDRNPLKRMKSQTSDDSSSHGYPSDKKIIVENLHLSDEKLDMGTIHEPLMTNSCEAEIICKDLYEAVRLAGTNDGNARVGYLQRSDSLSRFDLYVMRQDESTSETRLHLALRELTMLDQLEIARRLCLATLQYYSASDAWRLRDISLLGPIVENETQRRFANLQFSVDLTTVSAGIMPMDGIQNTSEPSVLHGPTIPLEEDASATFTEEGISCIYGVNDLALCNLGLTLTEIGYRKPVRELRALCDLHEIISGRKLLNGLHTSLGPRYQEVVQKCLQCVFGAGSDLSKETLQNAVYSEVVCPPEDMIEGFKKLLIVPWILKPWNAAVFGEI
ncbi:hypothetical protein LTR28_003259, partial [Elasticomyces elasticus]